MVLKKLKWWNFKPKKAEIKLWNSIWYLKINVDIYFGARNEEEGFKK